MAQINLTIPDGQIQRIINAFSAYYSYEGNRLDENETEAQFAKRMLGEHVKLIVQRQERDTYEQSFNFTEPDVT